MSDTQVTERQLQALAAAAAHDLRTPLSALSGEVELALRREPSAAAYREALVRIADRVTELVDLTGDLAVLARPDGTAPSPAPTVSLEAALGAIRVRYSITRRGAVVVDADGAAAVAGDEKHLVRALTLLMDHAVEHRGDSPAVFLRSLTPADAGQTAEWVDLLLSALPSGFPSRVWHHLFAGAATEDREPAPGLIRLRTARRLLADCDGLLDVVSVDGVESVRIRLRRA
jgi:signal transduction histidine kinase